MLRLFSGSVEFGGAERVIATLEKEINGGVE
jgi:hypothetical protein